MNSQSHWQDAEDAARWLASKDSLRGLLLLLTRLLAAQPGLRVAEAVRYNGLAGGGSENPIGARSQLLANLPYTLRGDGVFVDLIETARKAAASVGDDALLDWRNAAACGRGHLRPDGYGIYRHGGRLYGFFLEYDQGTMSVGDHLRKFAAYFDYLASGEFNREYEGFPTILVVTKHRMAEERIARAARAAALGRATPIPLLLTYEWRIYRDPDDPDGLQGQVWREPDSARRRRWFLAASQTGTRHERTAQPWTRSTRLSAAPR